MVDSEYHTDNNKSLEISITATIKDPAMLRFVPDHHSTKRMCKQAVKNLLFVIRYAPERLKTQGMCDKAVVRNDWMLKPILDCYQNK